MKKESECVVKIKQEFLWLLNETIAYFKNEFMAFLLLGLSILLMIYGKGIFNSKGVGYAVAMAYVTGYMVYIITSYYPQRKAIKKNFKVIQNDLRGLCREINYIFAILEYECDKLEKDENYNIIYDDEKRYAKISYFYDSKYLPNIGGMYYQIHRDVSEKIVTIHKHIDSICGMRLEIDPLLVDLLLEVRNDVFLNRLKFWGEMFEFNKEYGIDYKKISISIPALAGMHELKKLTNRFRTYPFVFETFMIEEAYQKDVDEYKELVKKTEEENPELLLLSMELKSKRNK